MATCKAESVIQRWESRDRPLFKGKLIDANGCCCAQGDVLRHAGKSDAELRAMDQAVADRETARLLGISRTHAVLLRVINDTADGAPQSVLKASGLRKILGPHWRLVLAFWRRMDDMTHDDWQKAAHAASGPYAAWAAARTAARDAARTAARDAAGDAARAATGAAARAAARVAARVAALELVGWSKLATPYFLRFFFSDPAAWVAAHEKDRDPGIVED